VDAKIEGPAENQAFRAGVPEAAARRKDNIGTPRMQVKHGLPHAGAGLNRDKGLGRL
jgi:hypothetical protein